MNTLSQQLLKMAKTIIKRPDVLIVGGGDCSSIVQSGYSINIDPKMNPDIVADFSECSFLPAKTFRLIMFERFSYPELFDGDMGLLIQAYRCLKPGGFISIITGSKAVDYLDAFKIILQDYGFDQIETAIGLHESVHIRARKLG